MSANAVIRSNNALKLSLQSWSPGLYHTLKKIFLSVKSAFLRSSPQEIVFAQIFLGGGWGEEASVSGRGSTLEHTTTIRTRLPELLRTFHIRTFLDLPCGDFHWVNHVDLGEVAYVGGDIVKDLAERNNRLYANNRRTFVHVDLIGDQLPPADMLMCRDCLPHLPTREIRRAIANIKRSGIRYLLTSTYPDCRVNEDIPMGKFRRVNLELKPFSFPPPLELLNDSDGVYTDKSLGLWTVADLPDAH